MISTNIRFCFVLCSLLLFLTTQRINCESQANGDDESVIIIRNWLWSRLTDQDGCNHHFCNTSDTSSDVDSHSQLPARTPDDSGTNLVQDNLFKLGKILDLDFYKWNLDIFRVHELSGGHSLAVMMFETFMHWQLFEEFVIDHDIFLNFLFRLEARYGDKNSFHNSIHAADVVQSTNHLISSTIFDGIFNKLEVMAAFFAAAIHDLDHQGYTNEFLVETSHPLAILYNDQSVAQHHSLAEAFKMLLLEEPETPSEDLSFIMSLASGQRRLFRKLVIEMVLALDPAKHNKLLESLKIIVQGKDIFFSRAVRYTSSDEGKFMRLQLLQVLLHSADVSQPTKSRSIYDKWLARLKEEACEQAKQEQALNIAVSSVCVRLESREVQMNYIDTVMNPWWKLWAEVVKYDGAVMLQNLISNRKFFATTFVGIDDVGAATRALASARSRIQVTRPPPPPPSKDSPDRHGKKPRHD